MSEDEIAVPSREPLRKRLMHFHLKSNRFERALFLQSHFVIRLIRITAFGEEGAVFK